MMSFGFIKGSEVLEPVVNGELVDVAVKIISSTKDDGAVIPNHRLCHGPLLSTRKWVRIDTWISWTLSDIVASSIPEHHTATRNGKHIRVGSSFVLPIRKMNH